MLLQLIGMNFLRAVLYVRDSAKTKHPPAEADDAIWMMLSTAITILTSATTVFAFWPALGSFSDALACDWNTVRGLAHTHTHTPVTRGAGTRHVAQQS